MNLSSQRHGNLYRFDQEVLHVHEEIYKGLEIRSTNKGSAWKSTSPQHNQCPNEWEEGLDNEEVEQAIPQYTKIIF
jgi:hypothetical protein